MATGSSTPQIYLKILHNKPLIADMHPPLRGNRTTNNPGLIDLPNPRRVPAEVAAEKQKKKETADAKARAKSVKLARVARVEKEIRIAQKEAARGSGQVRKQGRVKKVFQRETPADEVDEVSSSPSLLGDLL